MPRRSCPRWSSDRPSPASRSRGASIRARWSAPARDLFVVADLRTVWVIGDLYERDFARVRVGSPATVTVPAAPGDVLRGRVTYIDPRVDPATRTAKVRVEVPNRGGG